MRSLRIIRILSSHLVFHKLTRRRKECFGRRFRQVCERLGPTYIKLGQILSMRYDLLGPEDCNELRNLLDNTEPFPYAIAREIIKHDLGAYPELLFKSFDPVPIASASISQVYKAVMRNGDVLAVKVRRPWIGKLIEQDLNLMRNCISIAKLLSPRMRKRGIGDIIDDLQKKMLSEINFRKEAQSILLVHKAYDHGKRKIRCDLGRVFFPRVYQEYCSYNVLTTEFLKGVPLSKYEEIKDDPAYDPKKTVVTLVNTATRQMFEDSCFYFHADPHPANIMAMKGGDIGLLDFGIVGIFDPAMTRRANNLFFAVYAKNVSGVTDAIIDLAHEKDLELRQVLRDDVEEYLEHTAVEGMGFWFIGMVRIFIKHRLKMPRELSLLGRSHIILDGVVHMVAPGMTMNDLVGVEFKRGIRRRMLKNITEAEYAPVIYKLSEKMKRHPGLVNKLIDTYASDPLRLVRDLKRSVA